jgi:hypothetical protein
MVADRLTGLSGQWRTVGLRAARDRPPTDDSSVSATVTRAVSIGGAQDRAPHQ